MARSKLLKWVAALLVCLPLVAYGGSDGIGLFRFGVRLAPEIVNLMTDAQWEPYPQISGPGGIFSLEGLYAVTGHVYFHPSAGIDFRTFYTELEIGIPCATLEGEEPCGGYWEGEDRNSFLYLEFPLLVQWKSSILFVELGPVFDILLFSKEEYVLPEKYRSERHYEDRRFGAGVAAGIGHAFDFGLFVDARVLFQFTDVVEGKREGLMLRQEEQMVSYDPETGETTAAKLSESGEYMGGSYYRLMKWQIGIGYWF